MEHVALRLEFSTDRFSLTGDLPVESNAGNRFYGEDLAKALCESLPQWKLGYLDEDWGWLVFSEKEANLLGKRNTICAYAFPEGGQSSNFGQWMLMLHTEQLVPWLTVFSRWRNERFDPELALALFRFVQQQAAVDLKASEVTLDRAGNERQVLPYVPLYLSKDSQSE